MYVNIVDRIKESEMEMNEWYAIHRKENLYKLKMKSNLYMDGQKEPVGVLISECTGILKDGEFIVIPTYNM